MSFSYPYCKHLLTNYISFRCVECQFTSLENCPRSEAHLDDLLASLPRSLDETYERMLLNIDEGSAKYARRALTFLCCAKRPLTVAEVIEGMAVELGDSPRLNTKRRLHDQDDLHQVCPGFIKVDVDPRGKELSAVQIAHFSVQEHLESERILQQRVAKFYVEAEKANAEIASLCLAYLLEPGLYADDHSKYPLALYAALYWHRHYDDNYKTMHLPDLAKRLFREKNGAFENWAKLYSRIIQSRYDNISVLYLASVLGLETVVSYLLSNKPNNIDSNHKGKLGEPLLVTASAGSEAVIHQQLDNGIDLNSGLTLPSPLWDKGADVNPGGSFLPLSAAIASGNEAIVRLLLDNGADVNPGGVVSPLSAAARSGNKAVIRLLLDNGADVNYGGTMSSPPLLAATKRGNEAVVRLLLENGAGDHAPGEDLRVALQSAVEIGSEGVVHLLLEHGADVNANASGATTLQIAMKEENYEIVKLLVDNGAILKRQQRRGE